MTEDELRAAARELLRRWDDEDTAELNDLSDELWAAVAAVRRALNDA